MTNVQKTLNVNPAGWEWYGKTYDHLDRSETQVVGARAASKWRLYLTAIPIVGIALLWWNYGTRVEFVWWTLGSFVSSSLFGISFYFMLKLKYGDRGVDFSFVSMSCLGVATIVLSFFQWDKTSSLTGTELPSAVCFMALTYLLHIGTPRKGKTINKYAEGTANPLKCFIYGEPGSVGDATDVFDAGNLKAGVRGEQNTAELLKLVSEIPGTNVFHGLRFPGSANADVDHAVVNGTTVFLIDSKQYRPGVYQWESEESNEIITGDGRTYENHMAAAAYGYQAILGRGVNVIPVVMIHGNGVIIGAYPAVSRGVRLMTADEATRFIGNTISDNLDLSKHNGHIINALLNNMK